MKKTVIRTPEQTTRVKREVEIPLDEQMLNDRREKAAHSQEIRDELLEALDKKQQKWKTEKDQLETQIQESDDFIARTLREIRVKKARITTMVDQHPNFETKKVEFYWPHKKGGKVVDSRDFTADDHQGILPFKKPKKKAMTGVETH